MIQIDKLKLEITDAAGHESRLKPIAERAAVILAGRLQESGACSKRTGAVPVNLNTMNDEQAAQAIADGWLQSIAMKAAFQ